MIINAKITNIVFHWNFKQTAILISKNVGISRAMVYKHIKSLMDDGLVGQTHQYEKYFLTDAGKMVII